MYSEKSLKNSIKLLAGPFPAMLQNFVTQRALQGHSKGTRALEGHLGSRALEALAHLGNQALGHSFTRSSLGYSDTRALEHSRHFILLFTAE